MPVDLYDPAGLWGDMSAEKSKRGLAVEINNGRAAMLGIFGFMAASKIDGSVPAPVSYTHLTLPTNREV